MSQYLDEKRSQVDVKPWIRHFEQQAASGVAVRSPVNSHYIVVSDSKEGAHQSSLKLPNIVSPVQQVVDQAKEDIKREREVGDPSTSDGQYKHKISSKDFLPAKRTKVSGSGRKRTFHKDIFSK